MDWVSEFAMHVAVGGFSIVLLSVWGWRYWRTHKAMKEDVAEDECVACNGKAITTLAPQAFLCDGCGFTWGKGMGALAEAQKRAQAEQMSPQQRHGIATSELGHADDCLVAALAAVEQGGHQLGWDLAIGGGIALDGQGDVYTRTRNEMVLETRSQIVRAQKHIANATIAVGKEEAKQELPKVYEALILLDAATGSMLADIAGHAQLRKLQTQAKQLRDVVGQARRDLAGAGPASG